MNISSKIASHIRDIPKSGIRDFFDIVSTMKDVISLGIGEPDFDTPWHVRESAIDSLERGATAYTSNLGLIELRRALSSYVKKTFGPIYDPVSEILITVGVSEALDLALRALIEPGDEVMYHEPCYVSYRPVIVFAHGVPVAIETRGEDNFRVTREQLEAKVTKKTKAIMLNYPNNPTGATLRPEDVAMVAEFATKHDLVVLTDEIYAELTYDGKHTCIAALPDMKERTIFFHGFSKAWAMTGFRIGYACAPAPLTDAMMKIHQYTMLCASITGQVAALEALSKPEEDIAEMRAEYERRRNFVYASFEEMGLPCPRPSGAFYTFPSLRNFKITSKDFALRLLNEEKVAMVPGGAFGPCGEGSVRCSYATSMEEIKEAMTRIGKFLKRLPSR